MFKIGDIKIKNNVVLAPMAGISNTSFRKIIKDMGAGLIYCEMVSDKAIVFGNEKTLQMLKMDNKERPIAQQIFGSDVESFVNAAKIVEKTMKPDIIDINMGCPVPKVALKNQAGSALLKNPKKIYEIVSSVVKAVSVPITVKIRSGWDNTSINAVEVAKILEEHEINTQIINARFLKPFDDKKILDVLKSANYCITIEDGCAIGGLGTAVKELAVKNQIQTRIEAFAYPDEYIKHGSVDELEKIYGMDAKSIAEKIIKLMRDYE